MFAVAEVGGEYVGAIGKPDAVECRARRLAQTIAPPRVLRQKRNECPACACTASATLSSAVKSRNSEVIWNERASPSALRR